MNCTGCGSLGACSPDCPLMICLTIESGGQNIASARIFPLRQTPDLIDYVARIEAPDGGMPMLRWVEVLGAPRDAGAVWVASEVMRRAFSLARVAPERWQ